MSTKSPVNSISSFQLISPYTLAGFTRRFSSV
jgi:hypothetical protein